MANLDVTLLHGFRPGGWGPTVRRFKEVALPGTLPTFRGWWCYKKRKENERNIFFLYNEQIVQSDWTHTHTCHTHTYIYMYMCVYIIINNYCNMNYNMCVCV